MVLNLIVSQSETIKSAVIVGCRAGGKPMGFKSKNSCAATTFYYCAILFFEKYSTSLKKRLTGEKIPKKSSENNCFLGRLDII
mgnify:CR=1 FL=1